jgi:hypothetical protein
MNIKLQIPFYKGIYINITVIMIAASLCTNKMPEDIKDAHIKKKPLVVMKRSQQHSNHHQIQHLDYKRIFSKSNASNKEAIHKICHRSIGNLRFSSRRQSDFTKQCLH